MEISCSHSENNPSIIYETIQKHWKELSPFIKNISNYYPNMINYIDIKMFEDDVDFYQKIQYLQNIFNRKNEIKEKFLDDEIVFKNLIKYNLKAIFLVPDRYLTEQHLRLFFQNLKSHLTFMQKDYLDDIKDMIIKLKDISSERMISFLKMTRESLTESNAEYIFNKLTDENIHNIPFLLKISEVFPEILLRINPQDITNDILMKALTYRGNFLMDILANKDHFKVTSLLALCRVAVSQNGLALSHIPQNLKTMEICQIALRQNGLAYRYVPGHLAKDPSLIKEALLHGGENILDVSMYWQSIEDSFCSTRLLKKIVAQNPKILKSIFLKRKDLGELYKIALSTDGMALRYIEKRRLEYVCQNTMVDNRKYTPEDFYKIALEQNENALEYIPQIYRGKPIWDILYRKNPQSHLWSKASTYRQYYQIDTPFEYSEDLDLFPKELFTMRNHLLNTLPLASTLPPIS